MARGKAKQPGHQHSGEYLHEVVAAVVAKEDCAKYMPFARELYATLHRPPVPDFTRRTKRVVMKHFVRGLHGRPMWLIGERLLGRLHPEPEVNRRS
jgi:hypothetical protein